MGSWLFRHAAGARAIPVDPQFRRDQEVPYHRHHVVCGFAGAAAELHVRHRGVGHFRRVHEFVVVIPDYRRFRGR